MSILFIIALAAVSNALWEKDPFLRDLGRTQVINQVIRGPVHCGTKEAAVRDSFKFPGLSPVPPFEVHLGDYIIPINYTIFRRRQIAFG